MNFINDDQIENNIELDDRNIDIDLVDIDLDLDINLLHHNPSFKKNIQYGNLNTLDWETFLENNRSKIQKILSITTLKNCTELDSFEECISIQLGLLDNLLYQAFKTNNSIQKDLLYLQKRLNWIQTILQNCNYLHNKLNSRSIISANLKSKIVKLHNQTFKIDWIINRSVKLNGTTKPGLKLRLDQIRQDILHTKRVIKHNKRVFECRENDLKIRSDFQNNPRNEIQKLFANVENIPCPIEVEDLNTFWSQESKS